MKTILVTGGTSGIGLEIVKALLHKGFRVISTTRNTLRSNNIATQLKRETNNDQLYFLEVDFASFASVSHFTNQVQLKFEKIDVLINNAGTWEMVFKESKDGIELNFQTNHLSPMLLTLNIIPLLKKSGNARIINTSSGAHRRGIYDFHDLEWRHKPYDGVATYSQSKLFNLWFTRKLIDFLNNPSITVNTVHPGYVKTALFNNMGNRNWEDVPDAQSGARSALYAALSPEIEHQSGLYLYHEEQDPAISDLAHNDEFADMLWNRSMFYIQSYITYNN